MSLENGIFQAMKNDTGVAALVGGNVFGSRVPNNMKDSLPAIVYHTFWSDTLRALDGPDSFRTKKVQIDCYARKYPDSVEIADAVRVLFEGFKGTLPTGVVVQVAMVEKDEDFPLEPGKPAQDFIYRRMLEVTFRYIES